MSRRALAIFYALSVLCLFAFAMGMLATARPLPNLGAPLHQLGARNGLRNQLRLRL